MFDPILLVKEWDKVFAVDLLQLALLTIVHHSEMFVIVSEVVQGKWPTLYNVTSKKGPSEEGALYNIIRSTRDTTKSP